MKIYYDSEVDVLKICFKNTGISESNETQPEMILDYDKEGNVVGIEIKNASQHLDNPYAVEYAVTSAKQTLSSTPETQQFLSIEERRAFMRLPISERRHRLSQQASAMVEHYQQDQEWQELLAGDIIDY